MRFLTILLLFSISLARAQSLNDSVLIDLYKKTINVLANDSMGGRPVSSIYEKKSAGFIADQFKQIGFKPKTQYFKYRQQDSLPLQSSLNIYCFINNKADSTVIIGAHYDHIGMGGALSMNMGKKGIHNGADDNASGIALLLGLAKELKTWDTKKYNIVFVAYSAHEIGLFGSEAFSGLAIKKYSPISLVLNFDMVGRMHPDLRWLKISGVNTLDQKRPFFDQESMNLKIRYESDSLLNQLDTKVFLKLKLPCLSFSTGSHDDYHKMTDDENKIYYPGILMIQKCIQNFMFLY